MSPSETPRAVTAPPSTAVPRGSPPEREKPSGPRGIVWNSSTPSSTRTEIDNGLGNCQRQGPQSSPVPSDEHEGLGRVLVAGHRDDSFFALECLAGARRIRDGQSTMCLKVVMQWCCDRDHPRFPNRRASVGQPPPQRMPSRDPMPGRDVDVDGFIHGVSRYRCGST